MTEFKILFLDIDGTILRPDDQVEDSTKEAVRIVQEKGLEVFLATGRPVHEIHDLGELLHIQNFIGYNGAYCKYNGTEIFKKAMSKEVVETYIQIAEEHGHEMILYTDTHNLFTVPDSELTIAFTKKFHLKRNKKLESVDLASILGITIINVAEEHVALYEATPDLHLSRINIEGFSHSYDVISDKVNKGIAVEEILQHLSINQEQSIAFGDGLNDKEMLQFVGEGFAMGNADPRLFDYAKNRTTEVTDNGIYNGLKSLKLVP